MKWDVTVYAADPLGKLSECEELFRYEAESPPVVGDFVTLMTSSEPMDHYRVTARRIGLKRYWYGDSIAESTVEIWVRDAAFSDPGRM